MDELVISAIADQVTTGIASQGPAVVLIVLLGLASSALLVTSVFRIR